MGNWTLVFSSGSGSLQRVHGPEPSERCNVDDAESKRAVSAQFAIETIVSVSAGRMEQVGQLLCDHCFGGDGVPRREPGDVGVGAPENPDPNPREPVDMQALARAAGNPPEGAPLSETVTGFSAWQGPAPSDDPPSNPPTLEEGEAQPVPQDEPGENVIAREEREAAERAEAEAAAEAEGTPEHEGGTPENEGGTPDEPFDTTSSAQDERALREPQDEREEEPF